MLNEDYKDILRAFIDENVKFLLVGAYAMAAHGYLRGTEDIDLWIEPSVANAMVVNSPMRLACRSIIFVPPVFTKNQ